MKGLLQIEKKKRYIFIFIILLILAFCNISSIIERYINFDINIFLYLGLIWGLNMIIKPVNMFK